MSEKADNTYVPNMCPACINEGRGIIGGEFEGFGKNEIYWRCFTGGHTYRLKITQMQKQP
tara:strand:- start:407 stop:586 length:180 start_codon:yes stop_codon:yes gene_type:complete